MEAVKAALKPYYAVGKITKNEYKDVMRSAVPKVNVDFLYISVIVNNSL